MTILSISDQSLLFFSTIVLGAFLRLLYDAIRIARRILPHGNIIVQIEDALYWVFVSAIMFYFMLVRNYGEIRGFSIIGAFLGMVMYHFLLSPFVIKIMIILVEFLQKVLTTVLRLLLFPFRILARILSTPIRKISVFTGKKYADTKKILRNGSHFVNKKRKKVVKDFKIMIKKH